MSDELRPCPFCGSEAAVTKVNLEPWDKDWVFYGVRCLEDYQDGNFQHGHFIGGYKTEAEAIAAWNTRVDDAPEQTVDNAQADSRERLEADINDSALFVFKEQIFALLDRQAAITERKFWECYANGNQWELHQYEKKCDELIAERDEWKAKVEYQQEILDCDCRDIRDFQNEIDRLIAEVEAQRKRANDAERGVLSEGWYVCRDRYEDDIAELTAERDLWIKRYQQAHKYALELTAERNELQAKVDSLRKRNDGKV